MTSRWQDPLHGWDNFFDEADARKCAAEKKAQGLRVRLTINPLTQGRRIYLHRVAWWPA